LNQAYKRRKAIMKKRKLRSIVAVVSIISLVGLVIYNGQVAAAVSPKAQGAPSKVKAVTAEKYAVLNPRGDMPAIDAKALASRLNTLTGKTVYVYGLDFRMNPGDEIMLMVARGLAQAVPGIKVVYLSDQYGDATVDTVIPAVRIVKHPVETENWNTFKEAEKADAVVTGLGF
jgi:hypothetical protein